MLSDPPNAKNGNPTAPSEDTHTEPHKNTLITVYSAYTYGILRHESKPAFIPAKIQWKTCTKTVTHARIWKILRLPACIYHLWTPCDILTSYAVGILTVKCTASTLTLCTEEYLISETRKHLAAFCKPSYNLLLCQKRWLFQIHALVNTTSVLSTGGLTESLSANYQQNCPLLGSVRVRTQHCWSVRVRTLPRGSDGQQYGLVPVCFKCPPRGSGPRLVADRADVVYSLPCNSRQQYWWHLTQR